jgi:hypothetical protein
VIILEQSLRLFDFALIMPDFIPEHIGQHKSNNNSLGRRTPVTGMRVPTFPEGNRFPRECTLVTERHKSTNNSLGSDYSASGCIVKAENPLVSPDPLFMSQP